MIMKPRYVCLLVFVMAPALIAVDISFAQTSTNSGSLSQYGIFGKFFDDISALYQDELNPDTGGFDPANEDINASFERAAKIGIDHTDDDSVTIPYATDDEITLFNKYVQEAYGASERFVPEGASEKSSGERFTPDNSDTEDFGSTAGSAENSEVSMMMLQNFRSDYSENPDSYAPVPDGIKINGNPLPGPWIMGWYYNQYLTKSMDDALESGLFGVYKLLQKESERIQHDMYLLRQKYMQDSIIKEEKKQNKFFEESDRVPKRAPGYSPTGDQSSIQQSPGKGQYPGPQYDSGERSGGIDGWTGTTGNQGGGWKGNDHNAGVEADFGPYFGPGNMPPPPDNKGGNSDDSDGGGEYDPWGSSDGGPIANVPSGGWASVPMAFSLDPYDIITHTPTWPDECFGALEGNTHWQDTLWFFSAYDREEVCMRIVMNGGYVLFIDENGNDTVDGCKEMLCNFYWPRTLNVYQVLDHPHYNTNGDSWIDSRDVAWPDVKAWRPTENTVHTMDELGIVAFNLDRYLNVKDDYMGENMGQYADCHYVNYDGSYNKPYFDWIEKEGECQRLAMHHMRITQYNPHGIVLEDGTFIVTYDFVSGFWGHEEVERAGEYYGI